MSSHDEKLLDDIGWRLLEELQVDARLSYTELGRRVGLSTPAVMERIHKMEDAGIITGYRAEVNPEKIGFQVTAFIRVRLGHEVVPRLESLFKEIPEIIECHRVTGNDSLIMKVHVTSIEHLETVIQRITPYGMPATSIVLSTPAPRRRLERKMITQAAKKTRGSQP
jgi:Lrp/AsnC family transcriptional regulator, leucine-responsive regulatory protein